MGVFDDLISFEKMIYSDNSKFESITIFNVDFLTDLLVNYPKYRPFQLSNVVRMCKELCDDPIFRKELFMKCFLESPVILYRLFNEGVFSISEILSELEQTPYCLVCYYFKNFVDNFEELIEYKIKECDLALLNNEDDIPELLEFGFLHSTIEHCLKYDDNDFLLKSMESPNFLEIDEASWSPFEWALKPECLNYLAFAGYFGSLKCFKSLLMNGFPIDKLVLESVICSGSEELFHMCLSPDIELSGLLFNAVQFCHFSIVEFLLERNVDINEQDVNVIMCVFLYHLLIMLAKVDT